MQTQDLQELDDFDRYEYSLGEGFTKHLTRLTYTVLNRYFHGDSCVELGAADGYGTEHLLKAFKKVVVVDGSRKMLDKLEARLSSPKLRVIHSYFEKLNVDTAFDTVLMAHTLDIVDDPLRVLHVVKKLSHSTTRVIIQVPNAHSLHRQAGVLLGMLPEECSLHERDKAVGHKRVYDMKSLIADVENAGFTVEKKGGFLIKPFSNAQMDLSIGDNEQAILAYSQLGENYPEIAAEIYVVCRLK